jgi:hypothetical protein
VHELAPCGRAAPLARLQRRVRCAVEEAAPEAAARGARSEPLAVLVGLVMAL